MANNQYVNKVQKADGTVLIDISSDTVTAGSMLSGTTAHDKSGAPIVGNIATGTAGTPTAEKGTVSNHSISVRPSVTNSAGYISGATIVGSAVTVSASELVSGTKDITSSGTSDVTNYKYVSVPKGAIVVSVSATSNTSKTISNSAITANHYVYNTTSPLIGSDMTWTTSAGSITLSCSKGVPAMNLMLCLDI